MKNKDKRLMAPRLHNLSIPLVALTGGIATGKSTVAQILTKENLPLIDADKLVKKIYEKAEVKEFIKSLAPHCVIKDSIDFKLLRKNFFNDFFIKDQVENYIYSHMELEFKRELETLKNPKFIIYDVPLLFEKRMEDRVDYKVLVYAPRELQLERLIKRDHMSQEEAENILNHQLPIEDKKSLSDYVIYNTKEYIHLVTEVDKLIRLLKKKYGN